MYIWLGISMFLAWLDMVLVVSGAIPAASWGYVIILAQGFCGGMLWSALVRHVKSHK